MEISVYQFQDYKKYLKALIKSQRENWGFISKLAEATGCQRSYLSRVINAEVHLTQDHAFHLSKFLGHTEAQSEYFSLMLESDRAATAEYRKKIQGKMKAIIQEQEDLQKLVNRPKVNLGEKEAVYYSQWIYSAIHILVSIPEYQTVQAITQKLQVESSLVDMALNQMKDMGLVKNDRGRWQYASSEIHVGRNSPLVVWHHNNWRGRSMLNAQKMNDQSLHFTVVQSVDKKALQQIRQLVLKTIEDFNRIAGPADCEELVNFNCDFWVV